MSTDARTVVQSAVRVVRQHLAVTQPSAASLPDFEVRLVSCTEIHGAFHLFFSVNEPVKAYYQVIVTEAHTTHPLYEIEEFVHQHSFTVAEHRAAPLIL